MARSKPAVAADPPTADTIAVRPGSGPCPVAPGRRGRLADPRFAAIREAVSALVKDGWFAITVAEADAGAVRALVHQIGGGKKGERRFSMRRVGAEDFIVMRWQ